MNSLITVKALILRKIHNSEKTNPQAIARTLKINYGYTTNLISQLEDEELIQSRQDGRRKVLSLTDTGEIVAEGVDTVVDACQYILNDKGIANRQVYGEESTN